MNLNSSSVILLLTFWNSGDSWYLENSTSQSACRTHSTITFLIRHGNSQSGSVTKIKALCNLARYHTCLNVAER